MSPRRRPIRHFPECEYASPDGDACHCAEWERELDEVAAEHEMDRRRNGDYDDCD